MTSPSYTFPAAGVPRLLASHPAEDSCRVLLLASETDWCTQFKDLAKQLGFRVKRLDNPVDALVHIHEFDPHLFVVSEYRDRDLMLEDVCDALRVPRQLRPLTLLATTRVPIPPGEDLGDLGVDEILEEAEDVRRYAGALVQHFRLTVAQRLVLDRERDILDSLPDALMIVDGDLTLWKVNRPFAALWGLNTAEPLRRHLGQPLLAALAGSLSHSSRRTPGQALAKALGQALRAGKNSFDCREAVGAEERTLAGQVTRIEGHEGHFLIALRDVTDHEQALLRESRRERLATIGNLSVGVAHEIQNPNTFSRVNAANLKLLLGALRPLLEDAIAREPGCKIGALPLSSVLDKIEAAVAGIEKASYRIGAVLETLKKFGRANGDEIGQADVAAVLAEAELLTRHVVRGRAELTMDLPPALPPVKAAAPELAQVFINLIENACQAFSFPSPQARGEGAAQIRVAAVSVGAEEIVIAVHDNGPGIDEKLQEQIFRPYFTTRAQGEGTGLGLSISSDILHRMGGDLTVRSRPGEGATFLVTLQRADSGVPADRS